MAGIVSKSVGHLFETAIRGFEKPMASAATAAMRETAEDAKTKSRQNIANAGFSARWQNALRADIYPKGQDSLSPAAFIHHNIDYSAVFEEGETIEGKPILWLPLPGVPKTQEARSAHQMKPSEWAAAFGPLVSVNVPGKPPMLFPKYKRVADRHGRKAKIAGDMRKPLYIGVDAVQIAKKFDVHAACEQAAALLPARYAANLKAT